MYLLIYTPLVTRPFVRTGTGTRQVQRKADCEGERAIHQYHRYPGSVGHKKGRKRVA